MEIEPHYPEVFAGATFKLALGETTIGELREALRKMDAELAGWGDDESKITVVDVHRDEGIMVTLDQPLWR